MPNWCFNTTEVLGPEKDVRELLRLAQQPQYEIEGEDLDGEIKVWETPFSMNGVIPMPSHLLHKKTSLGSDGEFKDAIAGNQDVEYSGWYHWRLAHWGTKWDLNPDTTQVDPLIVQDDNASFEMAYDTAWSPVCDFWLQVSKKFPSLRIDVRYYEEGCNFIGQAIFEGGETLADECGEITSEDYVKAGATLNAEGIVDWDEDQDYDLMLLFPLVEL
jgi:hypothetical protein